MNFGIASRSGWHWVTTPKYIILQLRILQTDKKHSHGNKVCARIRNTCYWLSWRNILSQSGEYFWSPFVSSIFKLTGVIALFHGQNHQMSSTIYCTVSIATYISQSGAVLITNTPAHIALSADIYHHWSYISTGSQLAVSLTLTVYILLKIATLLSLAGHNSRTSGAKNTNYLVTHIVLLANNFVWLCCGWFCVFF